MAINIIPTSSAEHIGKLLAQKKDVKVIFPEKNKEGKRYFPDGEVYIKLPKSKEQKKGFHILHSGAPNPNDGLIELFWLLRSVYETFAVPLKVSFTYFPYGMQDNVFSYGEINASKELTNILKKYYNINIIYSIDAHFAHKEWVKYLPIRNISAIPLLKQAAKKDYSDIVYVAPDKGAADRFKIELYFDKVRIDSHTTEMVVPDHVKPQLVGKNVAIVDDVLETGGTMNNAYNLSKECNAKDVVALVTHGVLQLGIDRISNKYDKLYLTNTIDRKEANVDITDLVLDALK